jgi:hypothetical protein
VLLRDDRAMQIVWPRLRFADQCSVRYLRGLVDLPLGPEKTSPPSLGHTGSSLTRSKVCFLCFTCYGMTCDIISSSLHSIRRREPASLFLQHKD